MRFVRFSLLGLAALPLIAASVPYFYSLLGGRPRIVFAAGYEKWHFLEPLHRQKATFISLLFGTAGDCNWDGHSLYIEGVCGECGEPWADPGAFVLAVVPRGLLYAHHLKERHHYNHLSEPILVSNRKLLLVGGCVSGCILLASCLVGPVHSWRRRRNGCCGQCGYCLTGNVSGICPECGTPIPERMRKWLKIQPVQAEQRAVPERDQNVDRPTLRSDEGVDEEGSGI